MSVLIKGMEMPYGCFVCPFMQPGFYKGVRLPCVCLANGNMPIKPSETDLRDGMCPLEEVKEGGKNET